MSSKLGLRISYESKLKKKKYSKQRAQPERKEHSTHTTRPKQQSWKWPGKELKVQERYPCTVHQTNMLEIGWPFRNGS